MLSMLMKKREASLLFECFIILKCFCSYRNVLYSFITIRKALPTEVSANFQSDILFPWAFNWSSSLRLLYFFVLLSYCFSGFLWGGVNSSWTLRKPVILKEEHLEEIATSLRKDRAGDDGLLESTNLPCPKERRQLRSQGQRTECIHLNSRAGRIRSFPGK